MNAYSAYRQQRDAGMSRIDLILAVYDGILGLLDRARQAPADVAEGLIARARLALTALASGVSTDADESSANFVRLYEYAAHCLSGGVESIQQVQSVLGTLREGFEAVREEATELERNGQITSLQSARMVQVTA